MAVVLARPEEAGPVAARLDDLVGEGAEVVLRERIALAESKAANVGRFDVGNSVARSPDLCRIAGGWLGGSGRRLGRDPGSHPLCGQSSDQQSAHGQQGEADPDSMTAPLHLFISSGGPSPPVLPCGLLALHLSLPLCESIESWQALVFSVSLLHLDLRPFRPSNHTAAALFLYREGRGPRQSGGSGDAETNVDGLNGPIAASRTLLERDTSVDWLVAKRCGYGVGGGPASDRN